MTTIDAAYAAYTTGRAAIIDTWMADPANSPTDGSPTPSRYHLDRDLEEHYRLRCPGSPDYTPPAADPAQAAKERDEALAEVADLLGSVAAGLTREYFLNQTINQLRADLAHAEDRLNAAPQMAGAL